jgi:hypothetical protein
MKKLGVFFCAFLLLLSVGTAHAVVTISNGIYDVAINDSMSEGFSLGSWTAATAASHPTGLGNDLLYSEGGGSFYAATNFSSLRVYGSLGPTDYTFDGSGGGVNMDPSFTTEGPSTAFGATDGWFTEWSIPGPLIVRQDVLIAGSTFADSAIYHTVEIHNTGEGEKFIGWRNLYDWQVDDPGTDDGPNNQVELSDGTVIVPATTVEFVHTPGTDDLVRVSIDPGMATYEPLLGLGFDPGFLAGLPTTPPDRYAYVSWPASFGTAFDYVIGPSDVTGDSAGLSWFGPDGPGIRIGAGETVRFTQTLFGVVEGGAPPGDAIPEPATMLLLGSGLVGLAGFRKRFKKR